MIDKCDVQVNIDILRSTVKVYEKGSSDLMGILSKLELELKKLDGSWDAEGKKAFDETFPGFYAAMKKHYDMMIELKKEMTMTLFEFDNLDSEILKLKG